MEESIKLSTLGQNVAVGDFYDYSCDQIINLDIPEVLTERQNGNKSNLTAVFYRTPSSQVHILVEPNSLSKSTYLNVNAHLEASLLAETYPNEVWFSQYLEEPKQFSGHQHPEFKATVSVHMKISERHETFIKDKRNFLSFVQASHPHLLKHSTHLVSEVSYGFDCVFVLEMPCQNLMDKAMYENQLFLEARKAFSKFNLYLPASYFLEDQQSKMDSILHLANWTVFTNLRSFDLFKTSLADCLESLNLLVRGRNNKNNYVPVELTLYPLASIAEGHRRIRDLGTDLMTRLSLIKITLQTIIAKLKSIVADGFVTAVPHLHLRIAEFYRCVQTLHTNSIRSIGTSLVEYRRCGNDNIGNVFSSIWNDYLAGDVLNLWIMKRQNEIFMLKRTLNGVDRVEWTTDDGDRAFVFKTRTVQDPVIARLHESLNLPTLSANRTWKTFEMFSSSLNDREILRRKLEIFATLPDRSGCPVYLTTSDTEEDGAVCQLNHPPDGRGGDEEYMSDVDTSDVENVATMDDCIETKKRNVYDEIYLGKSLNRIALAFASKSQLVKGQPAVYLLQADERIHPASGFRWLDIGRPQTDHSVHKIVVLMGSSGCGKRQLIDGMVNYILGVGWDDPFRFRIVQQEPEERRYSVTAYTVHHTEGMKIPYGITIIDTPEYGESGGGIEDDEEINRIIARFLSHPQTRKQFDSVNAVGFVASSSDERLTAAQQYMLDSLPSIFGRKIRNHLRLLVTFSDGVTPTILESIRQSRIAGLVESGTCIIRHHKFNNSALFADNNVGGDGADDETSFDQVFWKLDRINYQSFFEKLSTMPNCKFKHKERNPNRGSVKVKAERIQNRLNSCQIEIAIPVKEEKLIVDDRVSMANGEALTSTESVNPHAGESEGDSPSTKQVARRWSISSFLPNFFKHS